MIPYSKYYSWFKKNIICSSDAVVCNKSVLFLFFFPVVLHAQQYDLLIKNGHVIDPKNNINTIKDIAIANGKIVKVDNDIPAAQSKKTIDATGLYVVPGLIDIHTHVFVGSKAGQICKWDLQCIAR